MLSEAPWPGPGCHLELKEASPSQSSPVPAGIGNKLRHVSMAPVGSCCPFKDQLRLSLCALSGDYIPVCFASGKEDFTVYCCDARWGHPTSPPSHLSPQSGSTPVNHFW